MHKIPPEPQPLKAEPTSLRCPFCRQIGMFQGFATQNDIGWVESEITEAGFYNHHYISGSRRCSNPDCAGLVFVVVKGDQVSESYPPETIDFDSSKLPQSIHDTLEEAIKCHGAGAYRASTLMVRRLLEELCADRGATGSDLKKRLVALSATIVVPQELIAATDELRILGNDAAHVEAKTYDDIGKDEAEIAIELAKELLKAVYQYSSLLERLKALKKPVAVAVEGQA